MAEHVMINVTAGGVRSIVRVQESDVRFRRNGVMACYGYSQSTVVLANRSDCRVRGSHRQETANKGCPPITGAGAPDDARPRCIPGKLRMPRVYASSKLLYVGVLEGPSRILILLSPLSYPRTPADLGMGSGLDAPEPLLLGRRADDGAVGRSRDERNPGRSVDGTASGAVTRRLPIELERRRIALTGTRSSSAYVKLAVDADCAPPLLVAAFATRLAHAMALRPPLDSSGDSTMLRRSSISDLSDLGLAARTRGIAAGTGILAEKALRGTSLSSPSEGEWEEYPGEVLNLKEGMAGTASLLEAYMLMNELRCEGYALSGETEPEVLLPESGTGLMLAGWYTLGERVSRRGAGREFALSVGTLTASEGREPSEVIISFSSATGVMGRPMSLRPG